jgi:hypothetical protein
MFVFVSVFVFVFGFAFVEIQMDIVDDGFQAGKMYTVWVRAVAVQQLPSKQEKVFPGPFASQLLCQL